MKGKKVTPGRIDISNKKTILQNSLLSRVCPWLFAIGLNILIYATLPIAPPIINFLDRSILNGKLSLGINAVLLGVGLILLLNLIIRHQTREPIRYLWLLAIFLAAFDIIQIPGTPAERVHFLEYGIVSILWWRVIRRYSSGKWKTCFTVLLLTTCFGCWDEMIQFFLPNRFYGYDDMIRNAAGGFIGMAYLGLIEREISFTNNAPNSSYQNES